MKEQPTIPIIKGFKYTPMETLGRFSYRFLYWLGYRVVLNLGHKLVDLANVICVASERRANQKMNEEMKEFFAKSQKMRQELKKNCI